MPQANDTYSFKGQEGQYDAHRPRWPEQFALHSLFKAGIARLDNKWVNTLTGGPPIVASIGAGSGSDAAVFKALGCKVYVVEPNAELLEKAKKNLAEIPQGEAIFLSGNAMDTGIPEKVDLVVAAQALHTMKGQFSDKYRPAGSEETNAEEVARAHWQALLPDDARPRVSVWYYNPDPHMEITRDLHDVLLQNCPKYAASKTPLLNAEYFAPNHFQPWMSAEDMRVSDILPVQTSQLARHEVGSWLGSYSFKPADPAEFAQAVTALQEQWFDKHSKDGIIALPYVGAVFQAPLRPDPFPMQNINAPIALRSPLEYDAETGASPSRPMLRPSTVLHKVHTNG
ncbi:MAG: methyltransferase domain-containing protein [Alphaproteobacteria bacterium]